MAISIRCENPDCDKSVRVHDDLVGKRIRCPSCGEAIAVPVPRASLVRRPSSPEDDNPLSSSAGKDDDQVGRSRKPRRNQLRKKRASVLVPVLIVGIILLVLAATGGVGVVLWPRIKERLQGDQEKLDVQAKESSKDTSKPSMPSLPSMSSTPSARWPGPAWAGIVLDFVDEADSKKSAEMASLAKRTFGTPDTEATEHNIEAMWQKKLSLKEIIQRYGAADRVTAVRKQGAEFDCHSYGSIALLVKKGEDTVAWFAAPNAWWCMGIRAKAEKER